MKYINNDELGDEFLYEKIDVWRLLETLIREKLGIELNDLNPRRLETGKWVVDKYYISLSHSGSYLMAGVSNKPIGVDVQRISEGRAGRALTEMCKEEREYYEKRDPWESLKCHSQKEAVYKLYFGEEMVTWEDKRKKINSLKYGDALVSYEIDEYYCSICSELIKKGVYVDISTNSNDKLIPCN